MTRLHNAINLHSPSSPMPQPLPDDDALLDRLQCETFEYFLKEVNPLNGLIADKTRDGWPASIAATGLALAAYPVGVERGLMTRDAAVTITLTTLRFFRDSVQGTAPDATGYKGFYYHFLDMTDGTASLAVRALDRRHGIPAGRRTDRRGLLRARHSGRTPDQDPG